MALIIAILWLLSPPVLLILFIVKCSEASKYKKMYDQLANEWMKKKNSETNAADVQPQTPPDAQSASGEQTQSAAVPSASPYNMPYITAVQKSESVQQPVTEQKPEPAQQPVTEEKPEPAQQLVTEQKPEPEQQPVTEEKSEPAEQTAAEQKPGPAQQTAPSSPYNMPGTAADTYTNAVPESRDSKVSSMNIMLILGALFIIIAGLIFATTTWAFLSSGIRAVVILSFSAIFFAASSFAERKLDLEKTGLLFYTLGSVFLPTTLIAAGYFKVFGEWFSLYGDGRPLLLAVTFAALSAVCVKGSCNYRSAAFSWAALISFSASVCSLILQFTDKAPYFALAASVYGLAVMFASERLSNIDSDKFETLLSQLNVFAAVNTMILSVSALIATGYDGGGVVTLVSCVIFSASYIKSCFTESSGFGGAIPFALFMTCGMFAAFSPDDFAGITNTVVAASAVTSVLSFMNIIPSGVKNALKYISGIFAALSLVICGSAAFMTEPSWVSLAAYALLAAEILALGLMHRNEKSGKLMIGIFPAACVIAAAMLSRLLFLGGALAPYAPALWLVIIAVMQCAFVFIKRLGIRTTASDAIFSLFSVIAEVCFLSGYKNTDGGLLSDTLIYLPAFLLSAAVIVMSVVGRDGIKRKFFACGAMLWGGGFGGFALSKVILHFFEGYGHADDAMLIGAAAALVIIMTLSMIINAKCLDSSLDRLISVIVRIDALIYAAALLDTYTPWAVIFALTAAYSVLRYAKSGTMYELVISAVSLAIGLAAFLCTDGSLWVIFGAYAALSAEILVSGIIMRGRKEGEMLISLLPASITVSAAMLAGAVYYNTHFPQDEVLSFVILLFMLAAFQTLFVTARKLGLRTGFSDVIYAAASVITGIIAMCDFQEDLVFGRADPHMFSSLLYLLAFLLTIWTLALPALKSDNDKKQLFFAGGAFLWGGLGVMPVSCFIRFAAQDHVIGTDMTNMLSSAVTVLLLTVFSLAVTFGSPKKPLDIVCMIITRAYAAIFAFILLADRGYSSPVFTVMTIMSAVRFIKKKSKPEFISMLLLFIASAGAASHDIFDVYAEQSLLFMCGAAAVIYITALFIGGEDPFAGTADAISRYAMGALVSSTLLWLAFETETPAYVVMTALFFLLTVTAFYNAKSTAFLVIPLTALYAAAVNQMDECLISFIYPKTGYSSYYNFLYGNYGMFNPINVVILGLIAASIIMSYILHRNVLLEKDGRRIYLDAFAFTRFAGLCAYYRAGVYDPRAEWLTVPLFGICLFTMSRKGQSDGKKRWIYTIAALSPVIAWISQPFFDVPDIISLEFSIVPILLYCVFLKLLWKHKSELIDGITFVVYLISFVTLFFDALNSGEIADGLIIVISSLMMLIFSFIVKRRKWFILSVAVLVISTLFMSRGFWASLAWWVYLLAAGLILIAIGAANEMKKQAAAKQEKSELEEKITRFMSEWTW